MKNIETISFCDSYIDTLAGIIQRDYVRHGTDFSRLAVVFGGKRPSLFLKKALSRNMKGAFFAPRFFTIDQFMGHVARQSHTYSDVSDLDQCYGLYQLARTVASEILKGREGFAQFLPWTRELIAFIDQLDLELIDDDVLMNIKANADIGYSVPEDINRLLRGIVKLRQAYRHDMEERQAASRGFIYRMAAEQMESAGLPEFDHVLFCNFFYFHASEEKVIRTLYDRGQGRLIFQGDERKWPVLERLGRRWGTALREGPEPEPTTFDLKLYSGFDGHSQVGLVREILKTIPDLKNTVVVLPDPDHLIPLLSELTGVVEEFNISMGYPLRRSSLYTLLTHIFGAQQSRRQGDYYARDYLKVLRHPFVKNLRIQDDSLVCRVVVNTIEDLLTGKRIGAVSGCRFVSLEQIESLPELIALAKDVLAENNVIIDSVDLTKTVRALHDSFFRSWEDLTTFGQLAQTMTPFLDLLVQKSSMGRYPLNMNIAARIDDVTREFARASFNQEPFESEDLFRVFDNKISGAMFAFQGSPFKGMQVLGLFETRSLNFDNVIVMDTNEGVLPNLNVYEPLIPREVMISLGLNRLELDEEIQRYLFMRLISSAKTVHLVYQENREKERSRFVEELVWENEKSGLPQPFLIRPSFTVNDISKGRRVQKTPAMLGVLQQHRYSASSLNLYLRNPMDFYTSYVLGLREQEDLLDEPEARQVGTFLHGLLEEAFAPFIGSAPKIDSAFHRQFLRLFEDRFEQTMARSMRSDAFLLKSVLSERLERFLEFEANNSCRQVNSIIALEKRFHDTLSLSCGEIAFTYVVDRMDRMPDGTLMVVDYKTGGMDLMPRAIEAIAAMDLSRQSVFSVLKSFQIPLYYLYLNKQFPDDKINVALYNLRTINFTPFIIDKSRFTRAQAVSTFSRALDFILSEILDPEIDFIDDPL